MPAARGSRGALGLFGVVIAVVVAEVEDAAIYSSGRGTNAQASQTTKEQI